MNSGGIEDQRANYERRARRQIDNIARFLDIFYAPVELVGSLLRPNAAPVPDEEITPSRVVMDSLRINHET